MSQHYHPNSNPITWWQRNLGGILLLICTVTFLVAFWFRWHNGIEATCPVGDRCTYQPHEPSP